LLPDHFLRVVQAFDLFVVSMPADLGGATGHFAVAARRRYPALRAIVFDVPSVVQMRQRKRTNGIEFIAGDFCTDPLPPADLIALGRVLHHRSEQLIVELPLTSVREAACRGACS